MLRSVFDDLFEWGHPTRQGGQRSCILELSHYRVPDPRALSPIAAATEPVTIADPTPPPKEQFSSMNVSDCVRVCVCACVRACVREGGTLTRMRDRDHGALLHPHGATHLKARPWTHEMALDSQHIDLDNSPHLSISQRSSCCLLPPSKSPFSLPCLRRYVSAVLHGCVLRLCKVGRCKHSILTAVEHAKEFELSPRA